MITHVKIKTGLDKQDERNCTDIFRDIMHLKHELNALANDVAATLDLRGSEMAIIDTLGKYGSLTMSELAAACFFSPPNATYTVQALEKRELLTRIRSESSQRVVVVDLTAAGEEIFRKSYPGIIQEVDRFLSRKLNIKERQTLARLLHKLRS
jgi:DNA-binding MarR family transcriptional regulator